MSNLEKAAQVVYESCYGRNLHPGQVSSIVRGLDDAGLLAPDLRIIRTLTELEALGSGAWLMSITGDDWDDVAMIQGDWIHDYGLESNDIFPLVILATGDQVRAAREAMGEEHG